MRHADELQDGDVSGSGRGGASDVMGDLARTLQQRHESVEDTLSAITTAAVGGVPGADFAGITLVGAQRRVENRGATDPLVAELDEVQANLGEGPCLDALWEHRTVVIDDMHTDDRWPRFAAAAADRGIGGSLSFQLFVEGDNLGALNLYGSCAGGFDQESEDVGLIFATHAAVALVGAQHEATLRVAVSSRDLIGQAKGILMERYRLTADQAFTLLTRASMTTNRKVTDIAAELATTGQLPADR